MCQIAIDRVDADTLQQATRFTVTVSGVCNHGGEVYMRVVRENGQMSTESAFVQISGEYRHVPIIYTAHNLSDHLDKVRAVVRCKKGSAYAESTL